MEPGLRILLAEDDPLNAMALATQIEALGHEDYTIVRDGAAAVEMARAGRFDLALLDVAMPRVSGLEAAEEIFRLRPIPILLLTGYTDAESVARATVVPVFHHIGKPVTLEELAPAIADTVRAFERWRTGTNRASMPDRAEAAQELVLRATRLLATTRGLSMQVARTRLDRFSRKEKTELAEAARTILIAEPPEPGGTDPI